MTRFIALILTVLLLAAMAQAQDQASRAQVAAATANAVAKLHDEIAKTQISANITVKNLLDRTDSASLLDLTLQRAQLIGGPRWIGDGICQVHLEIAGPRVVQALTQIAAIHPDSSPIDAAALQRQLADWSTRSFSASGTSMGAAYVQQLRPRTDRWAAVPDAARRQAVNAAIADAAGRLLQSIQPIALNGGKTLADALEHPAVRRQIQDWIMSRPVTNVSFRDDLAVTVELATPPDQVAQVIQSAVTAQQDFPQPTAAQWQQVRQEVARRLVPASGVGHVAAGVTLEQTATTRGLFVIPDQPPEWIGRQMEAEGVIHAQGSQLKGARAAEHRAIRQLTELVNNLPLTPERTLGDAARNDPAVAQAITQALRHAHTDRAEYRADGGVSVRMSLDLRDLWQELDALRP